MFVLLRRKAAADEAAVGGTTSQSTFASFDHNLRKNPKREALEEPAFGSLRQLLRRARAEEDQGAAGSKLLQEDPEARSLVALRLCKEINYLSAHARHNPKIRLQFLGVKGCELPAAVSAGDNPDLACGVQVTPFARISGIAMAGS